MFNRNWVNGKDVNGQSLDYQYVIAKANWTAKATVSLNAAHIANISAQWQVRTTLSDASILQSAVPAEINWEVVSSTSFTGYRQTFVSCEWVGASNTTFTGGGIVDLISAPLHRCFKVGPYTAQFYVNSITNQFYVDDLYRNQAA